MDFRPRFSYPIAIALAAAFLVSTGSTPARAASIGDYVAPFQSLFSTFENAFAQLVALVEPHHTVTVEISPAAMWHASGETASAAACNSILATSQPAASPTVVYIDTAPKASTPSASRAASITATPALPLAPQAQLASYVTQSDLTTQLQAATNALRSLIYQEASNAGTVGEGQYSSGGITNNIALSNVINQLSGVAITGGTITGATLNSVSGLSAAEIPALPYLSTSGGSLSGALGIGTTSPSDLFALNGAAYLADIAMPPVTINRLYSNSGNLYWAGNLLGGATTGNWSSDGTNVWRVGGNVGIGTSSPTAAALVVAGSSVDLEGNNPAYNFYSTGAHLTRWGLQVLDANNDFRILDGGSDYFHITQGARLALAPHRQQPHCPLQVAAILRERLLPLAARLALLQRRGCPTFLQALRVPESRGLITDTGLFGTVPGHLIRIPHLELTAMLIPEAECPAIHIKPFGPMHRLGQTTPDMSGR